jgi:hypothetical protein
MEDSAGMPLVYQSSGHQQLGGIRQQRLSDRNSSQMTFAPQRPQATLTSSDPMHIYHTAGLPAGQMPPQGAHFAHPGQSGLPPDFDSHVRERVYRPIRKRYLQGEIFQKLEFILSGETRRRVYSFIRPENQRYRLSDKLEAAVEQFFGEEDDPDIPKDDYDAAMQQQSYPSANTMHFGQPMAPHLGYGQPMYNQYPPMQPMYGQYPPMQPMYGQYPPMQPAYPQPIYGQYPPMQPMHGHFASMQPMHGQPTMAGQHHHESFGPTEPPAYHPPNSYVPIKKNSQQPGLGAKLSSNSNALLQSSQFSEGQVEGEPYDLLLPPPATKKTTRVYKPIKPSNHPGALSEKFSYNGQSLLESDHEAVFVASAPPASQQIEERRLGYNGHPERDGPAHLKASHPADSHFMQRKNDPPPNPFEEAHNDYSASKQQDQVNYFQQAHEDFHRQPQPTDDRPAEDHHKEKKEKKDKKDKKEKKDKKDKKDKKHKSEHKHHDPSSADISIEKKEKKDRRDRTEDQDSDTQYHSINKTLDLKDKHVHAINLSPVHPEHPPLESHADANHTPPNLSHTDHKSLREDNQDNLAKSNLESSVEKKTQIRVVRHPKKQPEKAKEPPGISAQFPDTQTQEYHVRMRDRQAKLQEFLERKMQNHRAKLEMKKKREEDRHSKHAGKPLWEANKMHLDGNSRVVRPEHTLSLMFEGKSYEQYYRDKYFQEVLGMHCPDEFMAEKQVPTVVRPGFSIKSPVGTRFRKNHSSSLQSSLNGPEFLGPALTIQEPVIIKYNTRPPQNSIDWENETMDRYRYFNQDRKEVKFIRSSRKQTITDALQLSGTLQPSLAQASSGLGFKESQSLKLPSLSKQKIGNASSRNQLNF